MQDQTEREPLAPPVITPSATIFAEASTFEPIVSQKFIEQQMRLLSQSITSSMGSMFDKLNQSIESRFQHISGEISQLQVRMDAYDLNRLSPQIDQQLLINSFQKISDDIRQTVNHSIAEFKYKIRKQSLRISSIEDFKRVEDDYASSLGLLRAKFGRLRGSAKAFTNVQAKELLALQEGMKNVQTELNIVWHFLSRLSSNLR